MAYSAQMQQQQQELADILRLPPDHQQRLKQEAGLGDKDLPSLTFDERVSTFWIWIAHGDSSLIIAQSNVSLACGGSEGV